MSFASPIWLLLLLLGIPIALLHTRTRQNRQVSSLLLWRRVAADQGSSQTTTLKPPRPSSLLILQLLILACIALSLSRPEWGGWQDSVHHRIMLLDVSGSMQAATEDGSRFTEARAYLRGELARLEGARGRISLVVASAQPSVMAARMTGSGEVGLALEGVRPTHTVADWTGVAGLISAMLVEGENTEITILTDAPGSVASQAVLMDRLGGRMTTEVLEFGSAVDNTALAGVTITPSDVERGRWRISGEILWFAPEGELWHPRSIPLRVLFEPAGTDGPLEWAAWEVDLLQPGRLPFEVEITLPGGGLVELQIPRAGVTYDSRASFVIRDEPRIARVLYVGEGNLHLQAALEAVAGVNLERVGEVPAFVEGYDLVILDGVSATDEVNASTLWIGVAPGIADVSLAEDMVPSGWRDDHPLGRSVDWSTISVTRAVWLPRLPGAEVLLEASSAPLIQARTTERGREVVLAFRPDPSDWASQLGFPIFVSNLIHWVASDVGMAMVTPCALGWECRLDPLGLKEGWHLLDPQGRELTFPSWRSAVVTNLDEDGSAIFRSFEMTFFPEQAGVYSLVSGETRQRIAVNGIDPGESDLSSPGAEGAGTWIAPGVRRLQVPPWKALLGLALAALLLEGWIAGRKAERFLRPEGLGSGNPLSGRRRIILALRGLTLVFSILALFNVSLVLPIRQNTVVLVLDDLRAYPDEVQGSVRSFLASVAEQTNWSSRVGVVGVSDGGRIDRDLGRKLEWKEPEPSAIPVSDLGVAISLAGALIPHGRGGRIVLVADGTETRGSLAYALPELLARNIPIDVFPVPDHPTEDVFVQRVVAPRRISAGESIRVSGLVHCDCSGPAAATVRVLRDGQQMSEQALELVPGTNRIEVPMVEEEVGQYLYELEVSVEQESFRKNDRGGLIVEVGPSPTVSIVTSEERWGFFLAEALEVQGMKSRVIAPEGVFARASSLGQLHPMWSDTDVVILLNAPAPAFSATQLEDLGRWVRDGGGLIILGGENAFGPGGYADTVLEEISPLSANILREDPKVAVSFVLDRSGSMMQVEGSLTRLQIAQLATVEAVGLLNDESLAGVVAFDSRAEVVVPLQPAGELESFQAGLQTMVAGGGTAIFPGLELAFEEMTKVDETFTRHIIVMTDGVSQPGEFDALLSQIVQEGITVSTVAVGRGGGTFLTERIARLGGGVAHATLDFQELPKIMAEEVMHLSGDPIHEVTVVPSWRQREGTFLSSMPESLPPLEGYVESTARPGATVYLMGPDDAPLLASWRHGLGKVVAFASHGAGTWASGWMADPEYPLWWAQMVRWVHPGTVGAGMDVQVRRNGDYGEIELSVIGPDGLGWPGIEVETSVSHEDAVRSDSIRLFEVEAGVYLGRFTTDRPGRYEVELRAPPLSREGLRHEVRTSLHVAFPARYDLTRADPELLRMLASVTQGRIVGVGDPIFPGGFLYQWNWRPAWQFWTVIALVLFMADLMLRYLPDIISLCHQRGVRVLTRLTVR